MPPLLLFCLISATNALNIFIYSAPIGFSQIQLMSSIADTLSVAGHNVTVIFPVIENKMKNYASATSTNIFIDMPDVIKEKQKSRTDDFWEVDPMFGNLYKVGSIATIQIDVCKYLLDHRGEYFQKLNISFDVALADIGGMCGFGLAQMLDVSNTMAVSAIGFMDGVSEAFHIPVMSSYIPGQLLYFTDRMNFWQRLWNFAWHSCSKPSYSMMLSWRYYTLFSNYGINFDVGKILPETNFLAVNTDEFLDIGRPVPQRVKYIGGIAVKPPGSMPETFERILNNSTSKGVIAISFGSYATTSNMPKEMKEAFLIAVDELRDYDFIFRVDCKDTNLSENHPNLYTAKWLPQRELLYHNRVKVFVSHAGMNSVLETTRAGKPALFIPIFGDQFQNAATVSRKNTSKIVWKSKLRGRAVVDALKELLTDPGYSIRAQRLAALMTSKRSTPEQRLLEAVEYTGKFGRIKDIDVVGFELSYLEYFSIDVIITWIFIIGMISTTIHILVWYPEKIAKFFS